VSCAPTSVASLSSDGPMSDLAHLQLVLARSMSVEQAAERYGYSERTIRHWASVAPISVRIAGGSHRISVPLADIYAVSLARNRSISWMARLHDVVPARRREFRAPIPASDPGNRARHRARRWRRG
jgi:hypothetical protein